jgi:nicotinate dehydrogenase subunit B
MQRRFFLKAGPALVVSFPALGTVLNAVAQTAPATAGAATKTLAKDLVEAWLAIDADGRATVYTGKVDLGTGVRTASAQMVAEELDVAFDQVEMVMGDTLLTVDQGQTASSVSISANQVLRQAGACARGALVAAAARKFGVPAADLSVANGVISTRDGRSVGYGELVQAEPLQMKLDPKVALKPHQQHKVVGQSVPRVDIPAKVFGSFTYMQDFRLPGMLHARVVRPPSIGSVLVRIDESSVAGIQGFVKVVRQNAFVAVVCKTEWAAVKAARELKIDWTVSETMPEQADLYAYWRQLPVVTTLTPAKKGDVQQALAGAAKRLKATYDYAANTHGSLGPSCAVADFRDGQCTIWSPSQATHSLQVELTTVIDLPKDKIRLIYVDGSGCYGRNGHEDCTADAALVSKLAGAPVRVQWMRADEHGWDPKSPPTLIDIEGGLDANGNAVAWNSEFFLAYNKGALTDFPLLAAVHGGSGKTGRHTGNLVKNADVLYEIPNMLTTVHRVKDDAFRTAHLRTPGRMQNTFANECFVDEMAAAANVDPAAWRKRYLSDPRSIAVIDDVCRLAGWSGQPSRAGAHAKGDIAKGRGLAYVRYENDRTYVALIADVEVNRRTGDIRVTDIWCSHDCGQIINPDGVRNQIEGGIVQTVSRTLMEEVTFDRSHITSLDWNSYPILRFTQVPKIHTSLINHPEAPSWGAGEMAPTIVSAAISSAVFDATGARLRSAPFKPAKVLQALAQGNRKGSKAQAA